MAAEVLELLSRRRARRGDRGRVPLAGARGDRSSSTCSAPTGSRSRLTGARPCSARRSADALLALARCALLDEGQATAGDLLEYLRAPGLLDHADDVDRLEAEVRREGLRTATEARARARLRVARDRCAASRRGSRGGAARKRPAAAGRPAPHGRARSSTPTRSSTPARSGRSRGRWPSSTISAGSGSTGAELIELLETLEVSGGPRSRGRCGARHRAAGDPGPALPRRVRVRPQESEFPLAAAPEPFLSDELRRELADVQRSAAAPAGGRARPRALPVLHERVPGDRAGHPQLPELGRGGQPRAALAVHRRRADLLVEDWPDRRRRRLLADVVWPADAGADRPRARPHPCGRVGAARRRGPVADRIAVGGGARPRPPPPDPVRGRARDVRRLPGQVARRARAPARARSSPIPMRSRAGATCTRCSSRCSSGSATRSRRESLPRALELLDEVLAERSHDDRYRPRRGRARGLDADRGRRPAPLPRTRGARRLRAGRRTDSSCGSGSRRTRTRCRRSCSARTRRGVRMRGIIDRVDANDGGPATAGPPRSSVTTRAAPGAPSRTAPGGPPTASSRSRCTCSPCASCSGSSPWPASTSRSAAATCARAGCSWHGDGARWLAGRPTTRATREELDELLDDARSGRSSSPRGCAAGSSSPCPATCSRDGCSYPGICRA